MKKTISSVILVAALSLVSTWAINIGPAWGFAEDMCYVPNGGGVANCTPLPLACYPVPKVTAACRSAAADAAAQAAKLYKDARSLVHVDATFVMAQAVGFSADDAYWIAAYDGATDTGSFQPLTLTGLPVDFGSLRTATLDGLARTSLSTGGVYFHFISPRSGDSLSTPAGIDGLHPDVGDANYEGFLAHLRSWAQAGTGATRPQCTDGLTMRTGAGDLALGSTCWAGSSGQPSKIYGQIAAIDSTTVSFVALTGPQVIVTASRTSPPITSNNFDGVVGTAHAPNARLGVYLHALADRISHHVCTDPSWLVGPSGTAQSFSVSMTGQDCTQGIHELRHIWETGIDQSLLAPQDQTLAAALTAVYIDLAAFASARGTLVAGADSSSARGAVVASLISALQIFDAARRVEAVREVGCGLGGQAFPGLTPCP